MEAADIIGDAIAVENLGAGGGAAGLDPALSSQLITFPSPFVARGSQNSSWAFQAAVLNNPKSTGKHYVEATVGGTIASGPMLGIFNQALTDMTVDGAPSSHPSARVVSQSTHVRLQQVLASTSNANFTPGTGGVFNAIGQAIGLGFDFDLGKVTLFSSVGVSDPLILSAWAPDTGPWSPVIFVRDTSEASYTAITMNVGQLPFIYHSDPSFIEWGGY